MEAHSREFMLKQSDKKAEFQREVVKTARHQRMGQRVQKMAMRFKTKGRMEYN